MKLNNSQSGFLPLQIYFKQGYNTSFIYGGEKHFDNMASFFYGNGFQNIIDQKDYQNPKFTATWGVRMRIYLIKRTKPLPNYRMKENHSLA